MTTHVTPPASSADSASAHAPAVDSARGAHASGSRMAWLGLGALLVLSVSVFWAFEALPFQDLPAHAGLIAMRHRFETSAFEQRFFVLAPHIGPYSLFRFLGEAFVRIIGPISAVRVLGTLPVLTTPLAMLFARRRLYADTTPDHGFFGVALSFGIMTLLGFASYLLGVAVMLVGLTLWLELVAYADDCPARRGAERRVLFRRELVMMAFAPVMFVAHGHAFLLFLMCAAISTVATGQLRARLVRLRVLVPALLLAAWVAWLERGATTPPGSVPRVPQLVPRFQGAADKLGLLISPTLMTRTGIDFMVGFVLLALTIACTVATLRSLGGARAAKDAPADVRHSRSLYACSGAIALAFLALPHAVGWFGFVDGRLVPVALILALLGVRRAALPRFVGYGLQYGAPLIASTIAVLAFVASFRFQEEAHGYKEVLARVPAESSLLNLPLDPNSDVFTAHPFVHYDKLALVERPIVVSDIWFHQGSALYPTPNNPALRLPQSYSESNLKVIDWPSYHLEDWDYVLIRTRPNASRPHTPSRLALEEHRGGWWLFKRADVASGY